MSHMSLKKCVVSLLAVVALGFGLWFHQEKKVEPPRAPQIDLISTPLSFEQNRGQTDAQITFLSRGNGSGLFLTPTQAVLSRHQHLPVSMHFVGANPSPTIAGLDELAGKSNYVVGNDPAQWTTDIPLYAQVKYRELYPGIDLVFYGNQKTLEYDVIVKPGADPNLFQFELRGTDHLSLDHEGNLVIGAGGKKKVFQQRPLIYQDIDGERKEIAGAFVIKGNNRIAFAVTHYDPSKTLVIDPRLEWSTYLGGSAEDGHDNNVALLLDASGNVFVAGRTLSPNFPISAGSFQTALGGYNDVFISKFTPQGQMVYSTFLGGNGGEFFVDPPTIDPFGNAYIAGITNSSNFPTTPGAFQTISRGGAEDVFLTKLSPQGQPVYSTLLGGTGDEDFFLSFAVDTSGNAYVAGQTLSGDFPTTPGAFQATSGGDFDTFVAKFTPRGQIVYSTYLGGYQQERYQKLKIDPSGNTYIVGLTASSDFPTTRGAFQTAFGGGGEDIFLTKLDHQGQPIYSTFLGGKEWESGDLSLAIDASGNAYIAGATTSPNFPTTQRAFQATFAGFSDGFITKLSPQGRPIYSTFLGGSRNDQGHPEAVESLIVDAQGNAYATGVTPSPDFPVTQSAFQRSIAAHNDFFLTKLSPQGQPIYSTFLGGTGDEVLKPFLGVDTFGNAYVAGITPSLDFPTTPGAFQTILAGAEDLVGTKDVFLTKLSPQGQPVYSTFLGGKKDEHIQVSSVALDASGGISVGGYTESPDFPTTSGAFQTTFAGGTRDAFFTTLSPRGRPVYSTFLGGSRGFDWINRLVVDAWGNAYVAGTTASNDFPTTQGAFQTTFGGGQGDLFLAKISSGQGKR